MWNKTLNYVFKVLIYPNFHIKVFKKMNIINKGKLDFANVKTEKKRNFLKVETESRKI